jgi:two-component sensor histidine kinase
LTPDSWRGAALQDIVATALAPFIDEGRPIQIGGEPATVPASATITLSLMLHELATNAAKYGALSVAEGRLAIRWTAADLGSSVAVDLQWQEDNGPPVSPPARQGFGSRLLTGSAQQLDARFEIDYAARGVRCRLRFSVPRDTTPPPIGSTT